MKFTIRMLLCCTVMLSSCNGFGPVDRSINTKNVAVANNDVVGEWKMDSFSYEYLTGTFKDSVVLRCKEDHTFTLNTTHSLFDEKLTQETTMGSWELTKFGEKTSLALQFTTINTTKTLDVYQKGKNYQLWYFLGDPDMGKRIRFLK